MAPDPSSNGSLYGKVLNRDGTIALIAVILLSFFIWVYWNTLTELTELSKAHTSALSEQTDILKDIRYALRGEAGLTFRNRAPSGPEQP